MKMTVCLKKTKLDKVSLKDWVLKFYVTPISKFIKI